MTILSTRKSKHNKNNMSYRFRNNCDEIEGQKTLLNDSMTYDLLVKKIIESLENIGSAMRKRINSLTVHGS